MSWTQVVNKLKRVKSKDDISASEIWPLKWVGEPCSHQPTQDRRPSRTGMNAASNCYLRNKIMVIQLYKEIHIIYQSQYLIAMQALAKFNE